MKNPDVMLIVAGIVMTQLAGLNVAGERRSGLCRHRKDIQKQQSLCFMGLWLWVQDFL